MLETLLGQAIVPVLERLEHEVKTPLPAVVILFCGGIPGPRIAVPRGSESVKASGEIRLRVRHSAVEGRSLFRAQGLFSGIPPASDITGFRLGGDVTDNGKARSKSLAVLHSDRTWYEWW
jgi:hypothetical protein